MHIHKIGLLSVLFVLPLIAIDDIATSPLLEDQESLGYYTTQNTIVERAKQEATRLKRLAKEKENKYWQEHRKIRKEKSNLTDFFSSLTKIIHEENKISFRPSKSEIETAIDNLYCSKKTNDQLTLRMLQQGKNEQTSEENIILATKNLVVIITPLQHYLHMAEGKFKHILYYLCCCCCCLDCE